MIVPGVKGRGGRWFSYTHRNCKMQSKGQSVSFSFLKKSPLKKEGVGRKALEGKETRFKLGRFSSTSSEWRGSNNVSKE